MEEQRKKRQENIVAGVVGAFLGTLLGVVCTVVIGQLGYVASVSGLIMAVGALKGYELLGGYRTPILSSFIELVGKLVFTFVFVRLFGYWGIIWTEPVIWFLMVIPLVVMTLKSPVVRMQQPRHKEL